MVNPESILKRFKTVRNRSLAICEPLEIDDFNMQAMVYGSPPKWNLGHCTWAFEAFALTECIASFKIYNKKYWFCFNSYYESLGERLQRDRRDLLSRPTVPEVYAYRSYVDLCVERYLTTEKHKVINMVDFLSRLELSINHEEQHQELFFTDLKHIFFNSPLQPTYLNKTLEQKVETAIPALKFKDFPGQLVDIGYQGDGFCYDNELGRHKVYLNPFSLMTRKVTNQEYLEFVEAGGYDQFQWWLSDAWTLIRMEKWEKPLYWEKIDGVWHEFTLHGFLPLEKNAPVCHISFYEADAYARFKNARLPTEFEWEHAASKKVNEIEDGNFIDNLYYHPRIEKTSSDECGNFFGNIWEWTMSAYHPYPHYKTPPGAVGEYNGKFMNNQRVLRGGSCVTPKDHIRLTYRNFFEPFQRWQFSGFRLAKDI